MSEPGRENSRQRIVAAAAALFARRGYEAVKLADIARAARVPVAGIERLFGDKTALIRALVEEFQARYYEAIMSIDATKPSVEERVGQVVRNIIALYRKHTPLAVAAMSAAYLDIPAIHKKGIQEAAKRCRQLDAYFRSLGQHTDDPAEMAISRGLLTTIIGTHFEARYLHEHRLKKSGPVVRKAAKQLLHEPELQFDDAFYVRYADLLTRFYVAGMAGMAGSGKAAGRDESAEFDFWSIGLF